MKSSQKYCNLGQFLDNNHFIPTLTSCTNKLCMKPQLFAQGCRKISIHDDIVQRKQGRGKNLLEVSQDDKLFHKGEGSIHSYRSPRNCFTKGKTLVSQTELTNKVSPRLLSPKQQKEVIEYLQKKNEELALENKQKQQIINRLIESGDHTSNTNQIQSPKKEQFLPQIPKSVESKRNKVNDIRFPQIKTPEPYIEHRITKKNVINDNTSNEQQNIFNVSFGNQLNLNDGTNQQNNQIPCSIQRFIPLNKKQTHPIQTGKKSHFSKLLLKLPQEFHLCSENQKKQI
ncbi:unnamed protein product (macronuclear) [Paramecium tetraurelia]|uniref:Uncharacterized protein n=1 Tax=Paramecium tetraurelia TaxID=5888 RepID=A0E0C8_PARTE|nr:uncharacterized protein GSPATT00021913001 [Paramecium tetraurelia]CAK88745.1 unnamed protein product [Paramecium tetraurelia]|eukprot:XP_001456142.1 hypothetical protein (macronuclear) [Paramecium tetraurelia strain d4-2]